MKSLLFNVTALMGFVFICFAWPKICRADWFLFAKTEKADLYYDKEDITHSSSGTANVWAKYVYTEAGIRDRVKRFGPKFEKLDHAITLLEFDCVGKLALSLSMVYFSKGKDVLEIQGPDNNWVYISTGSPFNTLYGEVCQ